MKHLYYQVRSLIRRIFIRSVYKSPLRRMLNFVWPIKIAEESIRIPVINGTGYENSLFLTEPWMMHVLKMLTKWKNGTFIDVGVNVGQTLIKYKSVGAGGRYLGFEANPECFFYLAALVKANGYKDVQIIPVGVSHRTGLTKMDFFYDTNTDSGASLVQAFRPDHQIFRSIYVPTFTWPDIATSLNVEKVSIVKIDVEGGELEVIESMKPMLKAQQPVLLLEVLPVFDAMKRPELKTRQDKLQQLLRDMDYVIYRVIKTEKNAFAGIEKVDDIGVHSDLSMCDYVGIPARESAALQDLVTL